MLLLTFGTKRMRMRKQARTREEKCHAVVEMHLHAAKGAGAHAMQHLCIHSPLHMQA